MTILLDLDPETEARLTAQAVQRGMAPEQYAGELVRENLPSHDTEKGELTREGLHASLTTSDTVYTEMPAPGTYVAPGTTVTLGS